MNALPETSAARPATWPTVVVVIPFYNGADFIERSVRSVFAQSVPASEVIVVNDGSRPEERAALDGLAARYPFRILDKENGGQGSARNAGVAASTADCICFLDQDDFYLPNHIETLVSSIPPDDRLFGFVYADLYEADGDGNIVRTGVVKEHAQHPKRNILDLLRHDMFVLPSAALVSREAFEAVGGFDSQFMGFEDDDLFLRIFRKGYSNHFVDKAVTVWCIHTASTSFGIRMVRSRFKYFKKLTQMFPDEHQRGRYWFRECLVPRFQPYFVNHAIESIKNDDQYRAEMSAILAEYAAMVLANPYVGRKKKLRLRLTVFLLEHSSPALVRFIGALTRMPGIRALRRLYA
ncbi:glycosyltransferase family 2 protein [Variovorax sp. PBL-E5]|uniref:glycosyltransferase family 2 protein n=1 Tax=Variovorax sp. PBL-E5 TaxID=434014 RepID=UPI00131665C1|nr:glycosyltransferase family A protein [Variovorax sp. PBL-E5]VTU19075.1 Hyaluronan synthase [Variovorax sp. PBL-E5]